MKTTMRICLTASLAIAACGSNGAKAGDMGTNADLAPPPCVTSPAADVLNACTTAQTGDPAKDYPYFPTLAPKGNLPPLP
jgi:hypothetical protein